MKKKEIEGEMEGTNINTNTGLPCCHSLPRLRAFGVYVDMNNRAWYNNNTKAYFSFVLSNSMGKRKPSSYPKKKNEDRYHRDRASLEDWTSAVNPDVLDRSIQTGILASKNTIDDFEKGILVGATVWNEEEQRPEVCIDVMDIVTRAMRIIQPIRNRGRKKQEIPNKTPAPVPNLRPWTIVQDCEQMFLQKEMDLMGVDQTILEEEEESEDDKKRYESMFGTKKENKKKQEQEKNVSRSSNEVPTKVPDAQEVMEPMVREFKKRQEAVQEEVKRKQRRDKLIRKAKEIDANVDTEIDAINVIRSNIRKEMKNKTKEEREDGDQEGEEENKLEEILDQEDEVDKKRRKMLERQMQYSKAPRGMMLSHMEDMKDDIHNEQAEKSMVWVEDPGYQYTVGYIANRRTAGVASAYPMIVRLCDFYDFEKADAYAKKQQKIKKVETWDSKANTYVTMNYPDGPLLQVFELYTEILLHYDNMDLFTREGQTRIQEKTSRVMQDLYEYSYMMQKRKEILDPEEYDKEMRKNKALARKVEMMQRREKQSTNKQRRIDKWKRRKVQRMVSKKAKAQERARRRLNDISKAEFREEDLSVDHINDDEIALFSAATEISKKRKEDILKNLPPSKRKEFEEEENMVKSQQKLTGKQIILDKDRYVDTYKEEMDDEGEGNENEEDEDGDGDIPPEKEEEIDQRKQKDVLEKIGHNTKCVYSEELDAPTIGEDQLFYPYSIIYDCTSEEENPLRPEAAGKEHVIIFYPSFPTRDHAFAFMRWNLAQDVSDLPIDVGKMRIKLTPDKITPSENKMFYRKEMQNEIVRSNRQNEIDKRNYFRKYGNEASVVDIEDKPKEVIDEATGKKVFEKRKFDPSTKRQSIPEVSSQPQHLEPSTKRKLKTGNDKTFEKNKETLDKFQHIMGLMGGK